jgi:uncharacterized protein (DUF58 family)
MLTHEQLAHVKAIELRSRKLVAGMFAGAYHSVYKGKGLAFSSVRPYDYGDDFRTIDWKVTARTGQPHIKQFVEERELTLFIVLDGSASLFFGTQIRQKRDFAAELAAILAYCATLNNDRVGLLIHTETVELLVPPRKGKNHIMRLISDIETFQPKGTQTNLGLAFQTAQRITPSGSLIFVVSDFLAPVDSYQQALYIAQQKHRVSCFVIQDALEQNIPQIGMLNIQDSETQQTHLIDTSSKEWQKNFAKQRDTLYAERETLFKKTNTPFLYLASDERISYALHRFFANL